MRGVAACSIDGDTEPQLRLVGEADAVAFLFPVFIRFATMCRAGGSMPDRQRPDHKLCEIVGHRPRFCSICRDAHDRATVPRLHGIRSSRTRIELFFLQLSAVPWPSITPPLARLAQLRCG